MAIKIKDLFFWLKPIRKIIIDPFWWVLLMILVLWVPFLRVWWWFFLPLFLSIELRILYLWWIQWDYNYAKIKWVLLEMIPPKEALIPLKAMEDIFTNMWGPLYNQANWREQWCEGDKPDAPGWMSWEIVSIEGKIHFYARVPSSVRSSLETALYGHYPEMEIYEVPDYTKNVPQNIPNQEWNVYGEDFIQAKPAPYPIRTYEDFFEPQGERISDEEKRLDPISSLLELLSGLGKGEQFWLQFITASVSQMDEPDFYSQAEKIITKISKRPEKKEKTFWQYLLEHFHHLIIGPTKEEKGDKVEYKWLDLAQSEEGERELLMTPGERETLTAVEEKIQRPIYRTTIRGVYVAKRENYSSVNRILTRTYFSHFQTQHMNYLRFSTSTRPKTHYFFRKSIPFLRTRRMFRNYVMRLPAHFPDRRKEAVLLNTEEMATLYHLPIKISGLVAPTMVRVESKKGGPPPNLPIG